MKMLLILALWVVGATDARAETFKCLQSDGKLSFQQLPCADGVPDTPAPPAPAPSNVAKPATPDPLSPIPTRRMREVLDLTALLERCRADEPGFAQRSAPLYEAWKVRHAAMLAGGGFHRRRVGDADARGLIAIE